MSDKERVGLAHAHSREAGTCLFTRAKTQFSRGYK